MLLETIEQANDIKKIKRDELPLLAQEIRDFLIRQISVTGGHLGSNLGAVELTMALHLALQLPEDISRGELLELELQVIVSCLVSDEN